VAKNSKCSICSHPHIEEINKAILAIDGVEITFDTVAEAFGLPESDLKIHAALHTQMPGAEFDTIVGKIRLREGEVLRNSYNEYFDTMKRLGAHIKKAIGIADGFLAGEEGKPPLYRMVDKSTIDLYLGCGNQVRETVSALAELDETVSEKEGGSKGILELVDAVRRSKHAS
jgi:hypothetical protein